MSEPEISLTCNSNPISRLLKIHGRRKSCYFLPRFTPSKKKILLKKKDNVKSIKLNTVWGCVFVTRSQKLYFRL